MRRSILVGAIALECSILITAPAQAHECANPLWAGIGLPHLRPRDRRGAK